MTAWSPTGSADPIGDTVAELRRRLPLPIRPWRFLREVRDGLVDAATAYRRAGLSADAAAGRAVADFGPVDEAAEAAAQSMVARAGRIAAATLSLAFLITIGGWIWLDLAEPVGPDGLSWQIWWFGTLALTAAVVGLMIMRMLRSWSRRGRATGTLITIQLVVALALSTTTLISSFVLSPGDPIVVFGAQPLTPHQAIETLSVLLQALIWITTACSAMSSLIARRITGSIERGGTRIRTGLPRSTA